MTVAELRAAARGLPGSAMVNLLLADPVGGDWREAREAYPDRELNGREWRDSLTVVVGEEVR